MLESGTGTAAPSADAASQPVASPQPSATPAPARDYSEAAWHASPTGLAEQAPQAPEGRPDAAAQPPDQAAIATGQSAIEQHLQSLPPEQAEPLRKELHGLRTNAGRVSAATRTATELHRVAEANHGAAEGYKSLLATALARAQAKGVDVTDLAVAGGVLPGQEGADVDFGPGDVGEEDTEEWARGQIAGMFAEALGGDPTFYGTEPEGGYKAAIQKTRGDIAKLSAQLEVQREAGNEAGIQLLQPQLDEAVDRYERQRSWQAMQPVISMILSQQRLIADLGRRFSGDDSARQANIVASEAFRAYAVQKDEATGRDAYPGIVGPDGAPTPNGKKIMTGIRDWCAARNLDPREQENFADAYHATVRRNPELVQATTAAPANGGPRTPGEASLGTGLPHSQAPTGGRIQPHTDPAAYVKTVADDNAAKLRNAFSHA